MQVKQKRISTAITVYHIMTHSQVISLEMDTTLQQQVEAIFQHLGLSPQEAIRLFYEQVLLKQTWPFETPPIPNATTQQALQEAQTRSGLHRVANVDELFKELGIE